MIMLFICSRRKGGVGCKYGLVNQLFFFPSFCNVCPSICSSTFISSYAAMGLTSRVARMCGSGRNKRKCSAGADSSSHYLVNSFRRAGMDRAWAASRLTA